MGEKKQQKAEVFLRHLTPLQGALERYGLRLLRSANELEDALQSAIANAYRDFHLYAEGTNFRAWIFRYLHLEILNRNRKFERDSHATLPPSLLAEDVPPHEMDEAHYSAFLEDPEIILDHCEEPLKEALRELAPLERSVFLLRAVGEFKYREIAEIVNVPVGTVMGYLARSRLRLRQRLLWFAKEKGLLNRESND